MVERGQTRVSLTIRRVLKVMKEDTSPANQAEQEELRRIETHWYDERRGEEGGGEGGKREGGVVEVAMKR